MAITKKRIFLYALGLVILAAGLTLNTKAALGVSPIVSVSYCLSQLSGMNFGDATFIWYCVLVLAQVVIHLIRKENRKIVPDLLQIVVSLLFTRVVNVFGAFIPEFGEGRPMLLRLTVLALAIIFTGIGAVMSLDMRIVPNPGDGIVQTLADVIGKKVGTAKNIFDVICVTTTACISLIFGGRLIGIGIGTIAAAIGVGRVMALFNKITGMDKI